jgi:hypothetical protein
MMNCKGFGRKRSWHNFKVIPRHSPEGTEENNERHQSGHPISRPIFEPGMPSTKQEF